MYTTLILPSCPKCETCDYTSYQTNLSECQKNITNLSTELQSRPIEYINNTIYIPTYKTIDKIEIIYSWIFVSSSFVLVILLSFKFNLFNLKGLINVHIELPNEIKQELEKFKHSVKWAKGIVIIFTLLLIIKIIILILA